MKEALKMAYDYIDEVDYGPYDSKPVLAAIKAALAQPEQMHIEKNMTLACPSYLHDYTTPPQRTWVGLTDEEIDIAWRSVDHTIPYAQFRIDVAKAIEAKLKEKNA